MSINRTLLISLMLISVSEDISAVVSYPCPLSLIFHWQNVNNFTLVIRNRLPCDRVMFLFCIAKFVGSCGSNVFMMLFVHFFAVDTVQVSETS